MSLHKIREILVGIGVDAALVDTCGPDARIRADLELDSTETTDLQVRLERECALKVDLWDRDDYSLGQLADAVREAPC
ncbi:acyl carrier protein [Actinokineospora sp. G85]|uniref:acyl carrier protein n=1 Tax=Actinokineospora sp. G85 TaxID=3406626 RepID=UPI003C77E385